MNKEETNVKEIIKLAVLSVKRLFHDNDYCDLRLESIEYDYIHGYYKDMWSIIISVVIDKESSTKPYITVIIDGYTNKIVKVDTKFMDS